MTENEFSPQMNRLAETFGKTVYGTERVKLIWLCVKDYSQPWFRELVSTMIGTLRQAPLLPDFQEAVLRERERLWTISKEQEHNDSKTWVSKFSTDDEKMMAQTIMRRLKGEISDQDWECFQNLMQQMEKGA